MEPTVSTSFQRGIHVVYLQGYVHAKIYKHSINIDRPSFISKQHPLTSVIVFSLKKVCCFLYTTNDGNEFGKMEL